MTLYSFARPSGLLVGVVLVALALGCQTPSQRAEQRHRVRKATSHLDLGADHLQNGRVALALREFLAAESLDPRNPRIQYGLGEAYWAREHLDEAEMHLRRALEMYPGYHDAHLHLTVLLLRLERFDEAIVECDALLDDPTFPNPQRALSNRGWAELRQGRKEAARRSLGLAREYSPGFWPATLK